MHPFASLKQALQIARCHESNYGQHHVPGYFLVWFAPRWQLPNRFHVSGLRDVKLRHLVLHVLSCMQFKVASCVHGTSAEPAVSVHPLSYIKNKL